MKYLPDPDLFFVHIPKCAGMSVRRALTQAGGESWTVIGADLGLDDADAARVTERGSGFDHPSLGRIHPAHVPLALMAEEMPRTFVALQGSRGFALTRDPRARFISALLQRLKEFKDAGAIRADDPIVAEEASRVCAWLDGRGPYCDIEYIHFSRQTDYTDLDGKRVLRALFPVERTDVLSDWIEVQTGLVVPIAHDHSRRQPKRWARTVPPLARFAARTVMPRRLKKSLHPLWVGSRLFDSAANSYDAVRFSADVEAFIRAYYAQDLALHAEAIALADGLSDQQTQ